MRVQKNFALPSRTKQSFKDECDINKIMKRFKKTVGTDYLNRFQGYLDGRYGDFSEVADYRSALHQVRQAEEVFMALPAKVRGRFSNDPAQFLDFVQNPNNAEELVSLGLATKTPDQDALSQSSQVETT